MKLTQRSASLEDSNELLSWRNNPETRLHSVNANPISHEEHQRWISDRLKRNHDEPFLVYSLENILIGMVRFDAVSESLDKFQISIMVNPTRQGEGLGTLLLRMSCETFFSKYPSRIIVARVHAENSVSISLFRKAGFELQFKEESFFYFEKTSE
jgi:RimJ/RimL family protein N-acetyltransferase